MIISESDKDLIKVAKNHGWTANLLRYDIEGIILEKGNISIWRIREGWQCADLIDGHYRNHRSYEALLMAFTVESPKGAALEEYFLVPAEDIEALRKARLKLFDVHYEGNDSVKDMVTHEISEPMWKITHKKYERIKK